MVCVAEEPTCDRLSAGPERRGRRIGRGLATAPPSVLRIGSPSVQEWLEQAATGLGALSSGVFGDGTGNFEVGLARVEIASEGCRASRPHQRPYPASGPALTLPALIYGSITGEGVEVGPATTDGADKSAAGRAPGVPVAFPPKCDARESCLARSPRAACGSSDVQPGSCSGIRARETRRRQRNGRRLSRAGVGREAVASGRCWSVSFGVGSAAVRLSFAVVV